MSHRGVYNGSVRKLVLAFDVGTTYSGISYCFMDPGQQPSVKGVTKYPAQEHIMGASKIPTIIYYDQAGKVRAVGAEAVREGIEEEAADQDWVKAEWFKLHLRSKNANDTRDITSQIPPLPPRKSIVDVWADFLTYLYRCARTYIEETQVNGISVFAFLCQQDQIDFVLSHPNGWEGKEQELMRNAAVKAGLIKNSAQGHEKLSFVTEGEASLHFAIENGVLTETKDGDGIVIIDAGGGTIDISSYKNDISKSKRTFEEIAAPQCHLYGSVFVTMHASGYLESFLTESDFLDDLEHIVKCFDRTTKIRFRSSDEPQYIKFGSTRDNDAACSIRFGQMKLEGTQVEEFFKPSAMCIIKAVVAQKKLIHGQIRHVVLVGGFAASDWLFHKIRSELAKFSLNVMRPENHVSKAVSDGAISFYLDHYVRTRIARFTYGSFGNIEYDPSNKDHFKRRHKKTVFPSGISVLPNHFTIILPKDTQVSETQEFREEYYEEYANASRFRETRSEVWGYRGNLDNPQWRDQDPCLSSTLLIECALLISSSANYKLLCTIQADLSRLPFETHGKGKNRVYRVHLALVLLFGLTEMQALVAWTDRVRNL
ncbi:hypothetical protein CPB83DRAFT_767302 [Crepidotus variabilis]|uniref:Heat shock 70 kDa protein 12A n=1 Tax=Crepidotus variabilis TaxID=179855 RepID=A0A9P6JPH4_9AGAR|nr:hypothetical protein CPB83DRAFT_767302 [Crepidotus variabilis]